MSAGAIITSDVAPQTLVGPEKTKAYARVTVPFTMETDYLTFRKGLRPLSRTPQRPVPTQTEQDEPKASG